VYQVAIDLSSVIFNIVVTGGLPVRADAYCCSYMLLGCPGMSHCANRQGTS